MAIKGYVVRCEQESGRPGMPHEYTGHNNTLAEAVSDLARAMPHYGKGSIFRLHPDGREERLPSYEEALGELERLRAVEALNVGAIDASLTRLGAVTGTIGPMPRHDPRCLIHDGAGCSFEAGCDAGRALMPPADPLAALEAAERQLLESARWTPGDRGFWIDPDDGTQWPREGAISDVRRRLAAKGGA